MGVAKWADGTSAPTMSLSKITTTTTGGKTTSTSAKVACAVSHVSGCHAVCELDAKATKFAEKGVYKLVVGGVPTAENSAFGATMNLGSVVLSVGKKATGGFGYSSA